MNADEEKWTEWRQQWISSRYVPRNAMPEIVKYPRTTIPPEPDKVTGSGFMQTICDMIDEGEIVRVLGDSLEECQRRTEAVLHGLNMVAQFTWDDVDMLKMSARTVLGAKEHKALLSIADRIEALLPLENSS